MATALEVARHIIHRAASADEPEFLSNLRLQKLLYYVQMHSLAQRDRAMFEQPIEAWKRGPVVEEIYDTFKAYGYNDIPVENVPTPSELTDEEKEFINSVWDRYKVFSAKGLSDMTHREKPWLKARGRLGPEDTCDNVISHASMKEFMLKGRPPVCEGEIQLSDAERELIVNHPRRLRDVP